ncbi:MAG: glutamate--tRNA ligase [Mariprofundaceae bacterium]|nr:glutamate--tRNA ligase [Mariprofundaceae bacterium]
MPQTPVRTRFAPSPTGLIHLGNVRTILLNWLYAKQEGGQFLLRFEDTDRDRSTNDFIEACKQDMQWLGLPWDGEVSFQSQHQAQHQQALETLHEKGLAYRCFCTEQQLNLDRKLNHARGLPSRYNGRCRNLRSEESEQRAESEAHVWRIASHQKEGEIIVKDTLRGDIQFSQRDLDDPIVLRTDGNFTFLLPNAIDDALQQISHVVRGDDHLSNSAYQVWILEKLDYQPPHYLHHGLLLGKDGSKLSKRTGSHSIRDLRENNISAQALVQSMLRLGHPNMPEEMLNTEAMCAAFQPEKLSCSAVRWQEDELSRWQKLIIHDMDTHALSEIIHASLPNIDAKTCLNFTQLIQGNLSRVDESQHYLRLLDSKHPIETEAKAILQETGVVFFQSALTLWQGQDWKTWQQAVRAETGNKGKTLFMPLRIALSGLKHGPQMNEMVEFLGQDGVRQRLEDTIQCL